jgi:TetR/AcrR family transcriptional repressor of mexJK operon
MKMPGPKDESAAKPRRGRPPDPERYRRILETARCHFHAHGLARANMGAISADAGVSKMTIYSHFQSKEGLFEAVVRDRTGRVMGGISSAEALDPKKPRQALLAIGEQFLTLARDEGELGQFRSLYGTAGTQPQACCAFYRQGADRLIGELAAYLRRANAAGTLTVRYPRQAADLFLAMFLGDGHIRGLLMLDPLDAQQNRTLLRETVRVFMAAYGRSGRGGAD